MLVATLNTAPETVAGSVETLEPDKRGVFDPVIGDIAAKMEEKVWESFVVFCCILQQRAKGWVL